MTRQRLRGTLYCIFALSGFAGLIYESIWTHYLKLFLGHAAYAQTLVLSIFMGGMAIGAWLAGDLSRRVRRPLLAYAVIEFVLGVLAILFDPLFRGLQGWFFESAAPGLQAPAAIETLKWTLAACAILPQSVLLGTTFPLMSAGIIRVAADMPGRVLSWLYFTNSAGAAIGVLASGFVLIAAVGLPGTILTAGLINFALVLALGLLLRDGDDVAPAMPQAAGGPTRGAGVFLAAAFLTGAASFLYEIGWIRMLSLVLGSATHSFEFMLSAFILGLALGGLLLRNRADRLAQPLRFLGAVQVVMATLALLSLVLYGATFDWMAALLETVQRNDRGYALFNLSSHAICLVLMLPVTICAGMTLPLITRLLLDRNLGEAAIGRVYAANTLGSIAGVLVAVHVVMPYLGLRQVIVVGAAVDFGLGLYLLWLARGTVTPAGRWALGAAAAAAVAIAVAVPLDASRLASGVFRTGAARLEADLLFHRDGKTASVDVYALGDLRTIATNGKADASLGSGGTPTEDDVTMIMTGALPALVHPELKRVAVIGFGSGRTTHTLLQSAQVEAVETIEIEPAMIEGARAFGGLVAAAYADPRSHIHIEDAKTYFARGKRTYDAIVSEPSNPWVSGVASLFSREFYAQVRRHLAPEGVFVQWLQLYEFDVGLMASILQALGMEFADYAVYLTNPHDVVVVARVSGRVPEPAWPPPAGMADLLRSVAIRSPDDVRALRVADRRQLEPWLDTLGMPPNSDYFPFVDQHAARHRFLGTRVTELAAIRPVAARLGGERPLRDVGPGLATQEAHAVGAFSRALLEQSAGTAAAAADMLLTVRAFQALCEPALQRAWLGSFERLAVRTIPWIAAEAAVAAAKALRASRCYGTAPAEVRRWIDFFEADATGDWPRVRELGIGLSHQREWHDAVTQFLVAETLLAHLRMGEVGPALVWARGLEGLPAPSTAVAFLMAHLRSRAAAR